MKPRWNERVRVKREVFRRRPEKPEAAGGNAGEKEEEKEKRIKRNFDLLFDCRETTTESPFS